MAGGWSVRGGEPCGGGGSGDAGEWSGTESPSGWLSKSPAHPTEKRGEGVRFDKASECGCVM